MPTTVPLEVFAGISARIAVGHPRDEVLAEAAVDAALYESAQAFWLGRIADEARAGRTGLSQRYAKLYAAAQAALLVPRKPERRVWRMAAPGKVGLGLPGASSSADRVGPMTPANGGTPGAAPAPMGAPNPLAPYKPLLTVEQFAAFRADLVLADEREHPAVWERFGLDAASWPREDAYWQAAFAGDNDLFQRYLRQFQYCRALMAPRV